MWPGKVPGRISQGTSLKQMTRLKEADMDPILGRLEGYDARLKRKTGASLRQLACRAAGAEEALIMDLLERVRFAAVPVRAGLGLIAGFSDTVAGIVSHLGFQTFVTESCDVAGMAEGIERGGDVLMLADDDRFVAVTPEGRHVVDNTLATAQGFVAGLELMKGNLSGAPALVLGCGPLGVAAARALVERGAEVALCDPRHDRIMAALGQMGPGAADRIRIEDADDVPAALRGYELILDATNAGGFMESAHLGPNAVVAAPGLPCALTPEAMAECEERILHDVLEIGTATMAVQAAATLAMRAEAREGHEG